MLMVNGTHEFNRRADDEGSKRPVGAVWHVLLLVVCSSIFSCNYSAHGIWVLWRNQSDRDEVPNS